MFKNHLKIAFRTLWKQKLSASINIFGLSLGIACAGVAFVFLRHEYSYDNFHREPENIYWITASMSQSMQLSSTPGPLAVVLQSNFMEITEAHRLEDHDIIVESGQELLSESGLFVEPNFFTFFEFPLIRGDRNRALSDVNSVVLSETMARKYFGSSNPIGATLPIHFRGKRTAFTVSGVVREAPSNSSFEFDFLLPLQTAYRNASDDLESDWRNFQVTSFVRLRSIQDFDPIVEKMAPFIKEKFEAIEGFEDPNFAFNLHALSDYHLGRGAAMQANGLKGSAEKSYIDIIAIIGLLILIIACLNFSNLSNAMSSQRLTEVGVRQVLGARC